MIIPKNKVQRSVLVSALVLSQSLWLLPQAVQADNSVKLAGQALFNVDGGSTPAQTVQNNLDNAIVAATDKTPASVNITYVNGTPVVTLGGYQVVTVDSDTAKSAGKSPAVVAKNWADSIRNSLRDQTSVNSYVSQLNGGYSSSAPAVAAAPAGSGNGGGSGNGSSYQEPANFNLRPQNNNNNNGNNSQDGIAQTGNQQANGGSNQYNGSAQGSNFSGSAGSGQYGGQANNGGNGGNNQMYQGSVVYAPAGLVLPVSLQTAISTQVAKPGDVIQAQLSQSMPLGNAQIPAGSVLTGTITDSEAGKRLSRSGELAIKFNRLRTPDGTEVPISAHLTGKIGKYDEKGSGSEEEMRGEGWKAKMGQTALRGVAGAGMGAALGTGLGAITGGLSGSRSVGMSTGMGAAFGTAMGGGVGMGSMLLRKGRDVIIPSGTNLSVQLDAPFSVGGNGGNGNGNGNGNSNIAGGFNAPRYGGGI